MKDHAGATSPNENRRHFRKRVRKALNDPDLQRALRQALVGIRERRNRAFQSFDFDAGRADLKRRRLANLERLQELLEEFKQRLEEVYGQLHHARAAEEAGRVRGHSSPRPGAGIGTKCARRATGRDALRHPGSGLGGNIASPPIGIPLGDVQGHLSAGGKGLAYLVCCH